MRGFLGDRPVARTPSDLGQQAPAFVARRRVAARMRFLCDREGARGIDRGEFAEGDLDLDRERLDVSTELAQHRSPQGA